MKDKPAYVGGRPVRDKLLPLADATINEQDILAVSDVLRTRQLGSGGVVRQLEQAVADYVGAKYAVAVTSGAAGLHIALMAAAIGIGEEVITSPLTHPATSNCVLYQGGLHTFADINPATLNIDAGVVAGKISGMTKALIPVHFAGNPCDMEQLWALAQKHNLVVIEDAAHALGASYQGQKIGQSIASDMVVFSFSDPQHCYAGQGGVVVTNSLDYYEWLLLSRDNGLVKDVDKLTKTNEPWRVEMQDRGYSYRLTDMTAAMALSQLDQSEFFIARRSAIAAQYNQVFAKHPAVVLPEQNKQGISTWHYYVLTLRPETLTVPRLDIFRALQAENIEVGVHYLPVFLHPYYLWIGHPDVCTLDTSLCPQAEAVYARLITLPLYPSMTDQDVADVINATLKVLNYYTRS